MPIAFETTERKQKIQGGKKTPCAQTSKLENKNEGRKSVLSILIARIISPQVNEHTSNFIM